jgi:hypothetical protein
VINEVGCRPALVAGADRLLGVELGQPARIALQLRERLRADVLLEEPAGNGDRDQTRDHDSGEEEGR